MERCSRCYVSVCGSENYSTIQKVAIQVATEHGQPIALRFGAEESGVLADLSCPTPEMADGLKKLLENCSRISDVKVSKKQWELITPQVVD